MTECAYRECGKSFSKRSRTLFCSRKCSESEVTARWNDRRIFSMEEISAMPRTVTVTKYVNRRIQVGVWGAEHVLVMESSIGVRLPRGATVHHINGDKGDNDPDNLELWLSNHPAGQRVECPNCGWPALGKR